MTAIATLTMNPSLDMGTAVGRVTANDKLRCEPPAYDAGGGGLNVARVVAELGEQVRAVYPAGGPAGQALEDLLGDLDTLAVPISGTTRTNVTVASRASGDQYRFVLPGPELSRDEWRACLDRVESLRPDPEYLVLSGSLPPGTPGDLFARVAATARDRGIRVVVDTSGEPLRRVAEHGTFLLKPNVRELGHLLDRDLKRDTDLEAAADRLADSGAAEIVVLSLGAGGAYVTGSGVEPTHVRSPTVPIESRVGAGDSMVGGLVVALSRGSPVSDAVRCGVAAGAAAVMTPGTQLCRREDVERLYDEMRPGREPS